jgi:hypothetical protein
MGEKTISCDRIIGGMGAIAPLRRGRNSQPPCNQGFATNSTMLALGRLRSLKGNRDRCRPGSRLDSIRKCLNPPRLRPDSGDTSPNSVPYLTMVSPEPNPAVPRPSMPRSRPSAVPFQTTRRQSRAALRHGAPKNARKNGDPGGKAFNNRFPPAKPKSYEQRTRLRLIFMPIAFGNSSRYFELWR